MDFNSFLDGFVRSSKAATAAKEQQQHQQHQQQPPQQPQQLQQAYQQPQQSFQPQHGGGQAQKPMDPLAMMFARQALQKQQSDPVQVVCMRTGLTQKFAQLSLEAASGDVEKAVRLFEERRHSLPRDAFAQQAPPQQQQQQQPPVQAVGAVVSQPAPSTLVIDDDSFGDFAAPHPQQHQLPLPVPAAPPQKVHIVDDDFGDFACSPAPVPVVGATNSKPAAVPSQTTLQAPAPAPAPSAAADDGFGDFARPSAQQPAKPQAAAPTPPAAAAASSSSSSFADGFGLAAAPQPVPKAAQPPAAAAAAAASSDDFGDFCSGRADAQTRGSKAGSSCDAAACTALLGMGEEKSAELSVLLEGCTLQEGVAGVLRHPQLSAGGLYGVGDLAALAGVPRDDLVQMNVASTKYAERIRAALDARDYPAAARANNERQAWVLTEGAKLLPQVDPRVRRGLEELSQAERHLMLLLLSACTADLVVVAVSCMEKVPEVSRLHRQAQFAAKALSKVQGHPWLATKLATIMSMLDELAMTLGVDSKLTPQQERDMWQAPNSGV